MDDEVSTGDDRSRRKDWWGVVLDAPDVAVLTRFYADLRGWTVWKQDEDGAALDLGEGVAYLAIQHNPDYERPVWPATAGSPQMMLHLDFEVTDLDAAVAHAVSLGAEAAGAPAPGRRQGAARPGRAPVLPLPLSRLRGQE